MRTIAALILLISASHADAQTKRSSTDYTGVRAECLPDGKNYRTLKCCIHRQEARGYGTSPDWCLANGYRK